MTLTARRGDVMVSADDIESMSTGEVRTVLTQSQIEGSQPTTRSPRITLGWLRKHLGWQKDAKSDEDGH